MVAIAAAQSGVDLGATETLRIDAVANNMSDIRFADEFRDGTIVIAEPQDYRLRLFSPNGRFIAAFGRQGGGPGEFGLIGWRHGFVGDSLWVMDGSQQRYTLVTSQGKLVRVDRAPVALTLSLERAISGIPFLRALAPNGELLMEESLPNLAGLPAAWRQVMEGNENAVFWVSASGRIDKLINSEPVAVQVCGREPVKQSECPRPQWAVGTDGTPTVLVTTRSINERTAHAEVVSRNGAGQVIFERTLQVPVVPYPRQHVDSILDDVRRHGSPASIAYWTHAAFPRHFAPVRNVIVGHDGTIWIAIYQPRDARRWFVLAPDGRVIGTLSTAPNVDIQTGTRDHFLATVADSDGLKSVERFAIVEPVPH